ncbi:MAG: FAD-dependent oxidoreductase [Solirubrobacterales bacterium]|nr:FAD-dependent oxidoreductase [Solirubrobacterales bacterium]
MATWPRIVIVGASLAGLRAAEQLRAAGHNGRIAVLGAEPHLPYNRPPLSKDVLSGPEPESPAELADQLAFRRRASIADVEFRLGDAVVTADLEAMTVTTDAGTTISYDGLVIATGLRPRRLCIPGPTAGRHVLRTVEDCHSLRAELLSHTPGRIVVVGAGFIGCEVAATARTLGHEVRVVDPAGPPMVRVIGAAAAAAIQRHHERAGIAFVPSVGVSAFAGHERVTGAVLTTGTVAAADVVVEAVGSVPNTEWLQGNGLDLSDGVLTDNRLSVVGARRVVAVGDIARFPNPLFDEVPRRVEHWSMPADTAKQAARTLVEELYGDDRGHGPFAPLPSFWSDQLDLRLQSAGSPALADEVSVVEGDLDDLPGGVLVSYTRAGRPVGMLAINLSPARQRELRSQLSTPVVAAA